MTAARASRTARARSAARLEAESPRTSTCWSRAIRENGDPIDLLEQKPTIRYHVFHETGIDITTEDGRTLQVVRPGTAFGFHVEHEGPVKGWQDEIQGATRVTDRFYRLDVPEEGTAQITTVIEAVEREGCLGLLWRLIKKLFGKS